MSRLSSEVRRCLEDSTGYPDSRSPTNAKNSSPKSVVRLPHIPLGVPELFTVGALTNPDFSVRRGKARFPGGCESHPATVAPAGSGQSGSWR